MTPEYAVEWYEFSCPRCGRRWADRYQVRRATDDAGQTRSYYAKDGLACEAPARAQAGCPACGHAPVHAGLLAGPPDRGVPAPVQGSPDGRGGHHATAPHHGTVHAWRRFTFEAIVSLHGASASDGGQPSEPGMHFPAEIHSLMVHLPRQDRPDAGDFVPAVITRDDGQRLRPGDSHVIVRISVPRDETSDTISAGSRFALWAGADVGRGTVLRRVVFD